MVPAARRPGARTVARLSETVKSSAKRTLVDVKAVVNTSAPGCSRSHPARGSASSYLWRRVLPLLGHVDRRFIAVDLIGMGQSGKPAIDYTLRDHIDYLVAFIDALGLSDITFVAHYWGTAICLDYLRRRPDRVRAVALMEGHVRALDGWADFDAGGRAIFQQLRTPGVGERMALEENFLIETLLPAGMQRTLTRRTRRVPTSVPGPGVAPSTAAMDPRDTHRRAAGRRGADPGTILGPLRRLTRTEAPCPRPARSRHQRRDGVLVPTNRARSQRRRRRRGLTLPARGPTDPTRGHPCPPDQPNRPLTSRGARRRQGHGAAAVRQKRLS
jgi:pimeloyl-ACP methyl ester carboxylesterase